MVDIARSNKKGLTKLGFSCRRGLTTVVTAALMLSTVAVLGGSLVAWSNGNLKNFETALSTSASNYTNKITEGLVIENIVFCSCSGSKNVINVTLTNTGTVGTTVNQIQVNGITITQYSKSATSLPANILPQQSYTVGAKFSGSAQWQSASLYSITVTTARGSVYETQAAAP